MDDPASTIAYAHESRSAPRHDEPVRVALWGTGWLLRIFGAVGGIGLLAAILSLGSPLLVPFVALALIVLLVVSGRCLDAARRRRATVVLTYLNQAVALHLPLTQMLAAARAAESRVLRRRLDRLQLSLLDGATLADALAVSVPEMPERSIELIASAERNGTLDDALRRLAREQTRDFSPQVVANRAFQDAYLLVVPVSLVAVVALLIVFVVPKFESIFRDFAIPLPTSTVTVLNFSRALGGPVMLVAAIALVLTCAHAFGQLFFTGRSYRPLRWLSDRLVWHTPIVRGIARDRGLADACHTIADALDSARAIDVAINEAAQAHLNLILRERIHVWASLVVSGVSVPDAARSAGLPKLISGMLVAGTSTPDLANAVRFCARYYDTRFTRAAVVLRNAMLPVLALVMGVLVGLVALSMFSPIVALIDAVIQHVHSPW